MGLFSSKKKYYVSSSSCPVFDPDTLINYYEAAILDHTANSSIDRSEYIKNYYSTSRLRNYRGWLEWCERNNFYDTFGRTSSSFYGDAVFDNTVITNAIINQVTLEPDDVFQVYQTDLNYFSEDFYIRYLATQQGKAELFYQASLADYELTFPTDNTIVATFKNGETVSGTLPTMTGNTRFLEISYSILRKYVSTEIDPETGEPIEVTNYRYLYGYYHYQEKTGNATLDTLIRNNEISEDQTFYPCIPLRTNTAWYTGNNAKLIGKALAALELTSKTNDPDATYDEFKTALVDGMSQGSINDIDYITLQLGVALNSTAPSDLRYLYEFFFNLHVNFALKNGGSVSDIWTPKYLDSGSGYLHSYFTGFWNRFSSAGYSDSFFTKFNIYCPSSNLNLTYSWGLTDYFETNGQFKPGAKPGEYGVLSNKFNYTYYTLEPVRDAEGNIVYKGNHEDGYEIQYESIRHDVQYTLTLFCNQYSISRWRFVAFIDLSEYNLIYHGKGVEYWAYDAIMDAASKATVTHNFAADNSNTSESQISSLTFYYVTAENDLDTGFVVPLEKNTFHEIGYVHQMQLAYRSAYLILNCWVKKKVKWYQHGIFGAIIGVVMVVVGVVLSVFSGGSSLYLTGLGAALLAGGTALFLASTIGQKVLSLISKVLTTILGQSIGEVAFSFIKTLIKVAVIAVAYYYGGPLGTFAAAVAASAFTATESLLAGQGLGSALLKGVAAGALTYVGGDVIQTYDDSLFNFIGDLGFDTTTQVGISQGIVSGTTSALYSLASGEDLKDALIAGLGSAFAAGAYSYIKNTYFNGDIVQDLIKFNDSDIPSGSITQESFGKYLSQSLTNEFQNNFLKNPNTYANLLGATAQEKAYHKLANIENDYKEFSNQYAAAQDVLNTVKNSVASTMTAEFIVKLQTNFGRFLNNSPEMMSSLNSENFLNFSLASGIDIARVTSASIGSFVDSKLSMDGYEASPLYFNQVDPSVIS